MLVDSIPPWQEWRVIVSDDFWRKYLLQSRLHFYGVLVGNHCKVKTNESA